jgi:DNA mismatch endonuclease, patch repair protein
VWQCIRAHSLPAGHLFPILKLLANWRYSESWLLRSRNGQPANAMADVYTKLKRSEVMAAVRSRSNRSTEVALARALRRGGVSGWRRHIPLPGTPDFVFAKSRLAVFVDGCFWHGCPRHYRPPSQNRAYWKQKLNRNRSRDLVVIQALTERGWSVIRFWEHEIRESPQSCAQRIRAFLAANSGLAGA